MTLAWWEISNGFSRVKQTDFGTGNQHYKGDGVCKVDHCNGVSLWTPRSMSHMRLLHNNNLSMQESGGKLWACCVSEQQEGPLHGHRHMNWRGTGDMYPPPSQRKPIVVSS